MGIAQCGSNRSNDGEKKAFQEEEWLTDQFPKTIRTPTSQNGLSDRRQMHALNDCSDHGCTQTHRFGDHIFGNSPSFLRRHEAGGRQADRYQGYFDGRDLIGNRYGKSSYLGLATTSGGGSPVAPKRNRKVMASDQR